MVQAGRDAEEVMSGWQWGALGIGALLVVVGAISWRKLVQWMLTSAHKVGTQEGAIQERERANQQARRAQEQAQANADNAERENSVLPLDEARKKARRKWRKDDTE